MSLNAIYSRFLANPSADALADNASLNYITTLTTIADAPAILKHFAAQSKQFTKKVDKVLSSIESANGLCVDVETTIEFLSSGGAYLPGLDDNFLADRLIMFPVVSGMRRLSPSDEKLIFARVLAPTGPHCQLRR